VQELLAGGLVDYLMLIFEGSKPGVLHDDTVCGPFEADRRHVGIVRENLGRQGKIGTSSAPTNRYLGLVDRVHMGSDMGFYRLTDPVDQRWKWLMNCMRNLSAAYFYQGKFWWNDADSCYLGDQELPETLEEGRCRLLYSALTGSFATIAQLLPLTEMAPSRLRLLKMGLPPVGIAAKPLDLFSADVASIYDWHLKTGWDVWHIITLINWETQERTFDLKLSDLGTLGRQWLYELWTDTYLGEVSDHAPFTLPPRTSRVYTLRPRREHPWFLATDLHVGMGYHELTQVQWEGEKRLLTARVDRPSDLTGKVVVVIPPGWKVTSSSSTLQVEEHIARVPVQFTEGPVNLTLRFERP
jgi:hypothetical protein